MQNKKPYLYFILALAILFVFSAPQEILAKPTEITESLKNKITQVMDILQNEQLKADQVKRRNLLRKKIDHCFNYKQMAFRALAKNWAPRTAEEKIEFTKRFKDLLERSYASKIETYSGGEIQYTDEIIKGKYAMVKTKFLQHGKFVSLDYKMIKENGDWQVYDIVIKGVSMIRNYRTQFTKTLSVNSFDYLMEELAEAVGEKSVVGMVPVKNRQETMN